MGLSVQVKSAKLKPTQTPGLKSLHKSAGLFSSLTREQKESIGLLQIGTFLEYFDLYLYVHMAVLLNEIFFPKTDPHTASLLTAVAFCSTYVFRPVGALIFGWIGDHIGRKPTIVITTAMMAISCLVMANLPTYAQIGIAAAWIMMICRIAQGISSMGEVMGAEIYLTETIQRPARYAVTAFLEVAAGLGALLALGIAFYVTSSGLNWRLAFWAGAAIAIVGAFARTRLRETPEFLEMKRQWLKKEIHETNLEADSVLGTDEGAQLNATWKEPVRAKTLVSFFLITCGWPFCMYVAYFYFNPLLKENFGYSPEDIIRHNFFLAFVSVVTNIFITYLSCRVHPLKINKIRGILGLFLMISLPFLIINSTNPAQLFLIQTFILIFALHDIPSCAVLISHFPLYRRFTFASVLWSLSRALMFAVPSFGLIYLGSYFGHFGLWVIALPTTFAFLYGVSHFKGLERKRNLYYSCGPSIS
ncbi:MAG: transporter [Alphaproteobacteria bacterium]|jgi:MFS family permease|nr:transporter [Alphaproteobacteria bacterium]